MDSYRKHVSTQSAVASANASYPDTIKTSKYWMFSDEQLLTVSSSGF